MGKGEIAYNECFLKNSVPFSSTLTFFVCKLFQFGREFVIWERVYPFPNNPWFLRVCSTSHLKTLWEKEKLLITSNFSFSRSVFYQIGELSAIFIKLEIVVCKLFQFGRVQNLSFGKGLNPITLSQTTNFRRFQSEGVCRWQFQISCKWRKIVEKGRKPCWKKRNYLIQTISPVPSVFLQDLYCRHIKTRACLVKS